MGIAALAASPAPLIGEIPLGTIADMSYAYLRRQGGAAAVMELVRFLIDRGKFKEDGNRHGYYGTVFKTLGGDTRFQKVEGKGRFMLKPTPGEKNVQIVMVESVPSEGGVGQPVVTRSGSDE